MAGKLGKLVEKAGLNPCSSGLPSLTGSVHAVANRKEVLIPVLVDYPL